MLTKRACMILVSLRINAFWLPLAVLPFRCLHEVAEGLDDMLALFVPAGKKPRAWANVAQLFLEELRAYGQLDFVDVNVRKTGERVKVKLLLR